MTEIVKFSDQRILDLFQDAQSELSPATREKYQRSLDLFALWLGTTRAKAANAFIALGSSEANHMAMQWRDYMQNQGLAPATVAHRLAALKNVVSVAQRCGMIEWSLSIRMPKVIGYRDVKGPPGDRVEALVDQLRATPSKKNIRNLAIVLLLHDRVLRRFEVVGLDLADVDLKQRRVQVRRKGHAGQRTWLTISTRACEAIATWIDLRGDSPGPLFVAPGRKTRLHVSTVNALVTVAGRQLGTKLHPHGFRHAGITRAAKSKKFSVIELQRFSGHSDPRTLMRYVDEVDDIGGDIAEHVGNEDKK